MKKPSRSMIDGTAVALAVIALILMILLMLRRCGSSVDMQPSSNSVENVYAPVDSSSTVIIMGRDSTTISSRKRSATTRRREKRSTKERAPKTYPERSPLDEPVDN